MFFLHPVTHPPFSSHPPINRSLSLMQSGPFFHCHATVPITSLIPTRMCVSVCVCVLDGYVPSGINSRWIRMSYLHIIITPHHMSAVTNWWQTYLAFLSSHVWVCVNVQLSVNKVLIQLCLVKGSSSLVFPEISWTRCTAHLSQLWVSLLSHWFYFSLHLTSKPTNPALCQQHDNARKALLGATWLSSHEVDIGSPAGLKVPVPVQW